MANSIVFQNNPSMLKAGIYGYDGSTYIPFPVTSTGIKTEGVVTGGTIGTVTVVSGVTNVTDVGTVTKVTTVASVTDVANVTTVASVTDVGNVGTVTKVTTVASVTDVGNVGTVTKVTTVASVTDVANVTTVASVTDVGNVAKVTTVEAVTGTVKVTLDGGMDASTQQISVVDTATGLSEAIDVSKYSDVSYYIYNTDTQATGSITLQMLASPSTDLAFAQINEVAVLTGTIPVIMTTDRFMKFNKIQATTTITTAQTLTIIMNGKY